MSSNLGELPNQSIQDAVLSRRTLPGRLSKVFRTLRSVPVPDVPPCVQRAKLCRNCSVILVVNHLGFRGRRPTWPGRERVPNRGVSCEDGLQMALKKVFSDVPGDGLLVCFKCAGKTLAHSGRDPKTHVQQLPKIGIIMGR